MSLLDQLPAVDQALIAQIVAAAERRDVAVYLVGGPVRDLLLGQTAVDLDFAVEGDAAALVTTLVNQAGGQADFSATGFFGTAKWQRDGLSSIDFARTRRESYATPGALPTVAAGAVSIADDLFRRDFTINALAVDLRNGQLCDPYGGRSDLQQGLIRVLHDQSFRDDPTRLFRATRFAARLNFRLDVHTAALIPAALPVIEQISGERIRHEIARILTEAEPEAALLRLDALHVLTTVQPDLRTDDWLICAFRALRWYLDALTHDTLALNYWAILGCRTEPLQRLNLSRAITESIAETRRIYLNFDQMTASTPPSIYVPFFERAPLAVLWAIAPLAIYRTRIEDCAARGQYVQPALSGDDLKAMGLQPGPRFRTILTALRAALLDSQISTAAEERTLLARWIAEGRYP